VESNEKIKRLYDEFEAFGKAIGPDHVAVWFWSKNVARESVPFHEAVDVARSARFCEKLKLFFGGVRNLPLKLSAYRNRILPDHNTRRNCIISMA
jgi:hypothetical protein